MTANSSIDLMVDIRHLTIGYRRRRRLLRVITDISLVIRPGEAYGLVGESGCGKTTVAMALMRYLPPNALVEGGTISFAGEDVLAASASALQRWRSDRMAMVSQDPGSALNPSIRIGTQVAEVYRYHQGMNNAEALDAARAMLGKVRIADPGAVLRRYPHELSGGQQQRVMIAMALSSSPDLLVLDEPTTGLDATVEAEVLDLVEGLRSEFHTAILFISHNLGIVARLCDRVGVLYAGQLIEEGPAAQLFAEPRHPYTLALLRCYPRPGVRKDTQRLESIPGSLPPLGARLQGCPYAPRCPIAAARCHMELPPLESVAPGRTSRCFFSSSVATIPRSSQATVAPASSGRADVLLEVHDLIKRYGAGTAGITVVAGVSFEVRRGEVFGLVGESGSGKTTLAPCIVGLVDAAGGLRFDGVELTAASRRRDRGLRRKLQMVFQNPDTALNPRHTVRLILGRALKLLGDAESRSERQRRLVELAASVRLEPHHLDMRPRALSGGLKQRVAIARSFAGVPALVLCDEPVSALDVSVQAAILNLLVDLQASKGVSYIFISHDLAVVRYLADRIGVMYLGQLVDIGPAEAVFEPPHHPYTEALISSVATTDLNDRGARIKLHGSLPSPADPPKGCRFHTRCHRNLGDICRDQEPPWQQDASGNSYRCHILPAELGRLQRAAGQGGGVMSLPLQERDKT